jgi:hypothetical protein
VDEDIIYVITEDMCNNTKESRFGEKINILTAYYWLADSAASSHVSNKRELFTEFEQLNTPVNGVGDAKTHTKGKGTVEIETEVDGRKYCLTLANVLYIPSNAHNLLSLGRWDAAGGTYEGGKGNITLRNRKNEKVIEVDKISNHLYQLRNIAVRLPTMPKIYAMQDHTPCTWEMWHRHFGHIAMSSLQLLAATGAVEGFASEKYDCAVCTQAKQHAQPFMRMEDQRLAAPGVLTHTDLWGKCAT